MSNKVLVPYVRTSCDYTAVVVRSSRTVVHRAVLRKTSQSAKKKSALDDSEPQRDSVPKPTTLATGHRASKARFSSLLLTTHLKAAEDAGNPR